ncbi:MAG: hypothetical protein ACYTGP_08310 [Planctomycetota bacterium]|jgi:hypothetical protein
MRRPSNPVRLGLAALALGLLTACAGVPLGTMLKMSSFSVEDFVKISPGQVRAAIQLDDTIRIRPDSTHLKVKVVGADGAQQAHKIPLRILRSGQSIGSDLPKAPGGRHWYRLDIAPENRPVFAELQKSMAQWDDRDGSLALEVASAFEEQPAEQKLDMEIRLQLDRRDGFFTLFSGTIDLPTTSDEQR